MHVHTAHSHLARPPSCLVRTSASRLYLPAHPTAHALVEKGLRTACQAQQTSGRACRSAARRSCVRALAAAEESGRSEEALLKGKHVLVTGASRGLGAAIACELARQAPLLVLAAGPDDEATAAELDKVVHQCRLNGATVVAVLSDLSRPEGVELVARNSQQHGVPDILVHAAAVLEATTFEGSNDKAQGPLEGDPNVWDRQTGLSLGAALRLTRRLTPRMAERGSGWLVFMSAEEAHQVWPDAPAFASTKWALRGWAKSITPALKAKGVHTILLSPPDGKGKLSPDGSAEALAKLLRSAQSKPNDIPEELVVPAQ